jgi:rhomboid protease GluP
VLIFLFVIVVAGYAVYAMKPEERTGLLRSVLAVVRRLKNLLVRTPAAPGPFSEALRARTPWAIVTISLAALNTLVFLRAVVGDGALSDAGTLVAWGGSFAPRTTNGEWWRLATTAFVHAGMLHLIVNVAALVQVGLLLERLVGHSTFAVVYFGAAVFASLVSLHTNPMLVNVGASGAIFGLYGLLAASSAWSLVQPSSVTIPLQAIARLGPTAAVFVLYTIVTGSPGIRPELAGLIVGFVCGVGLTRGIGERKPGWRPLAATLGATVLIAAAVALPIRGVADVRPEIERIVAIEGRTTGAYEAAVNQFRLGAIKAEALAQLIDRTIMPELHAAQGRLKALDRDRVPQEHQPLVADADEYLRLRDESWRLRAEALRKSNMATLRKADRTELASLAALKKIQPADQQ